MPATTPTKTKPSTQTLKTSVAKSKVLEVTETNSKDQSTPAPRVVAAVKEVALSQDTKQSETTDKTAAKRMVQLADQWRNCHKPHRI